MHFPNQAERPHSRWPRVPRALRYGRGRRRAAGQSAAGYLQSAIPLLLALAASLGLPGAARGQSAALPLARSDVDTLLSLRAPEAPAGRAARVSAWYEWSNNAIALSEGGKEEYPPTGYSGGTGFFQHNDFREVSWGSGAWQWSAGTGSVQVIRGNADAAHAWLDLKADTIAAGHLYLPALAENESTWQWMGVRHAVRGSLVRRPAAAWLSLRALQAFRYKEYSFAGAFLDERLQGDLTLRSYRGIDFPSAAGWGWAVQAGGAWEWRPGAHILLDVDGAAGQVYWSRVRELTAQVDTGAFAADPDGFIRDLPFLTGRETYRSLTRSVEPQWRLAASYPLGRQSLVALGTHRYSQYGWRLGLCRPMGRSSQLLLHAGGPPTGFGAAYATGRFLIALGTDNVSPGRARSLQAQVAGALAW